MLFPSPEDGDIIFAVSQSKGNDEEDVEFYKSITSATMNNLANMHRCVAWIQGAAAWLVHGKQNANLPPSKHPDKQEVLFMVGQELGAKQYSQICFIRRDENGKLLKLEPEERKEEDTNFTGRMVINLDWAM